MKLEDFSLRIVYEKDGAEVVTEDGDSVVSVEKEIADGRLTVVLRSDRPVRLRSARMVQPREYSPEERFFGGGYQSWTRTLEYGPKDRQRGLLGPSRLPVARTFSAASGDYAFVNYGRKLFHSHGYTYIRRGDRTELFGSLDESTGFTVFYADMKENVFAVVKDVEGAEFSGEYRLFDILHAEGGYDEVFDSYFAAYPVKAPRRQIKRLAGYTSWYNYYQKIDEKIILRDLESMYKTAGNAANIFQIDDGYESKVGDWLIVDREKFPGGMKAMADAIHNRGYLAGLWLAPFAAQRDSDIVKKRPDWLVRGKNGKPLVAGVAWGGFYALDSENKGVRDYLKGVFDTVFGKWGFDMVKLDFLYAACMEPRNGKSRGALMHDAMAFLRECVGDKLLLGCGVPMCSSFGFVDACRTGCDAELSFADRYYVSCTNQEIVSTRHSIENTVFRRHLNGRVFLSDPDVFFLRDGGMKKTNYTDTQKALLAKVNKMLGSVLFVSDNVGMYDAEKRAMLLDAFAPFEGKVTGAEMTGKDTVNVYFEENGTEKTLSFDLSTGDTEVRADK